MSNQNNSLEHDVMEHILKLSRTFRRHPNGGHRISNGGYRITNEVIKNDGIRTTDLAKKLDVRPASLSEALKKLEERGYIHREQDPNDLRIIRIYATDQIRQEHREWKERNRIYAERMQQCITEEESELFCNICDKLCMFFTANHEGSTDQTQEGNHPKDDVIRYS